jgi:hypothetical protein
MLGFCLVEPLPSLLHACYVIADSIYFERANADSVCLASFAWPFELDADPVYFEPWKRARI